MAATIMHHVVSGAQAVQQAVDNEIKSIGKELDPDELTLHMQKTYFALRMILIVIAIAFPIALIYFGYDRGIAWQGSMSAYYHALGSESQTNRDIFVGCLAATGAMLMAYRGHGGGENWLLNLAGLLAIMVAAFPTEWQCLSDCRGWRSIHGYSAISFFICIALVAIFCKSNTLKYLKSLDMAAYKRYRSWYWVAGSLIVALPVAAAVFAPAHKVFLIEAGGLYPFALYWSIKTLELRLTRKLWNKRMTQEETSQAPTTPSTLPMPGVGLRDVAM